MERDAAKSVSPTEKRELDNKGQPDHLGTSLLHEIELGLRCATRRK